MSEYQKPAPRFLTGDPHEARKRNFTRHEKDVVKSLRAIPTIASGSKGQKGDVHAGQLMVEAKCTVKDSISLKLKWLDKLVKEASEAGMEPALFVRFEAAKFAGATDWVVIPAGRYHELLELERAALSS